LAGEGHVMHPNHLARVIIRAAKRRTTITYGELAGELGLIARGLGPQLGQLEAWCGQHKLPPLTVAVVRQDTGRPSDEGRYNARRYADMSDEEIEALQQSIFDHDWDKYGKVFG